MFMKESPKAPTPRRIAGANLDGGEDEMMDEGDDIVHLARFLAHTWALIDDFVYKNCNGDALMEYPVIQGTKNQLNLRAIGQQPFDHAKIKSAVDKLLKHGREMESDFEWVCNECGAHEYTSAVRESDIGNLACCLCGCDEFHKELICQKK